LSASERALLVNPLEITPEIEAQASQVTAGLTNAAARAVALFGEVARLGRGFGEGGRRTADQALKASEDWQARLSCQEYAKLLVAMARGSPGEPAVLEELERLAEGGDLASQFALAKAFFEQQPPRTEEAMRWLLAAAEQGEPQAQLNYARNLLGLRGSEAAREAMQWFTRAAQQGDAEAQYHLGLMLYNGRLVPLDNPAASQWVLLAAGAGNADAQHLLKEMRLFLSAGELAEARKRADGFKPTMEGRTGTRPRD
jgi:hypothetical protein